MCSVGLVFHGLNKLARAGRLILNLILVRHGYPPAIIYKRDRARYLRALQRADTGDASALGEMLARAILDSLHRFVIPAVADPDRLVPLAALDTPGMKTSALGAAQCPPTATGPV